MFYELRQPIMGLAFVLGLLIAASTASAGNGTSPNQRQVSEGVPIPDFYHGAWSGKAEYCHKESSENYFIDGLEMSGWEVSWKVLRTMTGNDDGVLVHAMHEEVEEAFPVQVILRKTGVDTISFQECREADCWDIILYKCRPTGFEE